MVSVVWRTALFSVLMLIIINGALADVNCNPPANGDWTFNSTNSTLVCDNGTAVVLNGSLILHDNATVTFTNGTNLSAASVQVSNASSSLLFANTSFMNATLNLSAGNTTFQDGASFNQTPTLSGGILAFLNTEITLSSPLALYGLAQGVLTNTTLSSSSIDLYNFSTLNIVGGSVLNASINIRGGNALVLQDASLVGTGSPAAIWVLADSGLLSNATLQNVSATNYTLFASKLHSLTLINSTLQQLSLTLGDGFEGATITSMNFSSIQLELFNYTYGLTNLTNVSSFSTSIYQGSSPIVNITDSRASTFSIMVSAATLNTSSLQQVSFGVANSTVTIDNSSSDSVTLSLHAAGPSVLNVSNTNIPLFITMDNSTGSSITFDRVNVSVAIFAYNSSLLSLGMATNISNATFGVANLSGQYGFSLNGNFTFLNSEPLAFYPNQSVTRVYPLSISYSGGAPLASSTVQVLTVASDVSSAIWNGTTDANGYAEPNITFNSSNYNDTFYLAVTTSSVLQTSPIGLLNDTPLNWTLEAMPILSLTATSGSIGSGTFGFNVTFSNDTVNATYAITNGSIWTNGSWNATQLSAASWSFEKSFDGLYLPTGSWTVNVTASNGSTDHSATASLTSIAAMQTTLTSAASQSATIGGSAVGFTFNITAKGAGSEIGAFLNLTRGSITYNASHALLVKGNVSVNVSGSPLYTSAGNVTLSAINATPSYILLNLTDDGSIVNGLVTLSITPYSGLVAGTYGGTYGFGVLG